jgi:hypothetical protein
MWQRALSPSRKRKTDTAVLVGHVEAGSLDHAALNARLDCGVFTLGLKDVVNRAHG